MGVSQDSQGQEGCLRVFYSGGNASPSEHPENIVQVPLASIMISYHYLTEAGKNLYRPSLGRYIKKRKARSGR